MLSVMCWYFGGTHSTLCLQFVVISSFSDDSWQDKGMTVYILGFTTDWILGDSDLNHVLGFNVFVNTFINKWVVLKSLILLKFLVL